MTLMVFRIVCLMGVAVVSAVAAFAQDHNSLRRGETNGAPQFRDSIRAALRRALEAEFGLAAPAAADGGEPQSGRRPPPRPADPRNQSSELTLEELLGAVDANHPKLRGADADRRIASAKRLEKQGAFDPVVFAGTDYLRYNSYFDDSTLSGKAASMRVAGGGVEFLTRSGVKIGAGARYNLGKVKSPLSPTGDGGEYFLEFKLPLLRDRGINKKSAAERQALLGEPLADAEFRAIRLDLLLKAAVSYWDWVAAKQRLAVARNLLALAEFRTRAVRDRVAAGDLPQVDVVEAELEVQRRQGSVVKADRDLQKEAFKLSLFLWLPNGAPAPAPREADAPAAMAPPVILADDRVAAGVRLASERRPELRAMGLTQEITRVELDLARNQRRPAVDLSLSPGRDTGLGSIGATVKAGVIFALPLRQRAADGRIGAATLKLEKLGLELTEERRRITTEVLDAASAVNTTVDRYRAAAQEVELSERLEQAERDRFALGDSTLFLVNQRERAAAEARVKLIDIQAEYEQALAAFRAVTAQY